MPDIHSINPWIIAHKDALTILIGAIAAGFGLYNYIKNVQTKRAEFIYKLHTDFFVSATYKKVRSVLDSEDKEERERYVTEEPEEFTDFLNFFELVAYLEKRGDLSMQDVLALLEYYLQLLCKHKAIREYIEKPSNGFGELDRVLAIMKKK
jgi:hypothetical protein